MESTTRIKFQILTSSLSLQSLLLILVLLSFINPTQQLLKILSPISLAKRFKDSTIQANYANFGYIPYGHSIIGRLYFEENNKEVCEPLAERVFEKDYDGDTTPFFLAYRGGCSFVKKVRNMEHIGVSVAIIIDDTKETDMSKVIMSDDGTGGGIRIPSMIISESDGMKLINFLNRATDDEKKSIAILADFQMDKPDDRVEYDIIYTSSNDRALDFIDDFANTDVHLGEGVLMTPHFAIWSCMNCEQEFKDKNCFGGGKYCAFDARDGAHKDNKMTGKDILMEDLREKCLYKWAYENNSTRVLYWIYMQLAHRNCYNTLNEDCFFAVVYYQKQINFIKVYECVTSSFSTREQHKWQKEGVVNSIFEEELEYLKHYGVGSIPSIVINNRTYRGSIDELAVYNAICAGFQNPPEICRQTLGIMTPPQVNEILKNNRGFGSITGMTIIVILVIFINLLLLYCYRRQSRREMHTDMKMQIESVVSQYIALSNDKSFKSQPQNK